MTPRRLPWLDPGRYRDAMDTWTIIGESASTTGGTGDEPELESSELAAVTGWAPKPEGWCRGAECIPASFIGDAATATRLTVAQIGDALGAPVAIDTEHRLAVIGTRLDASTSLASGIAPDVDLLGLDGDRHGLFDESDGKTLVVAFSSWCGCRYDLPGWKAIKDELAAGSFDVVAVAIDDSPDLVAPWAEPVDFPVLVDTERTFADTYGLTNVPTIFWLDEDRRIVRQPAPEFSDDQFTEIHGVESGPHLEALRRWVLEDELPDDSHRPSDGIVADELLVGHVGSPVGHAHGSSTCRGPPWRCCPSV